MGINLAANTNSNDFVINERIKALFTKFIQSSGFCSTKLAPALLDG